MTGQEPHREWKPPMSIQDFAHSNSRNYFPIIRPDSEEIRVLGGGSLVDYAKLADNTSTGESDREGLKEPSGDLGSED